MLKTKLGEAGPDGRRQAICIENSEFTEEFDYLYIAVGQYFDRSIIPEDMMDKKGNLIIDAMSLQSKAHPHIFCCSEFYYSPESVIEAIASGKWAGESVHRYLRGTDMYAGRPPEALTHSDVYKGRVRIGEVVKDIPVERANKVKRIPLPKESVEARLNSCYLEVVKPYSEEDAMREASRCLHCANCGVCKECVSACEADAINHDQLPEIIHDKVGAIVVATGYKSFDPKAIPTYHYKEPGYEGVITGLEFERLTNSAGPTDGKIIIPKTNKKPKSIAFINCIGSRDKNYHEYCSRYCCTASIKHAYLMKEKYGSDMDTLLFYKDIRTFGKGYEELYNRSRSKGVDYIKGVPSEIRMDVDGSLYFDVYNVDLEKNISYRPDLIVLQTAMEPQEDAKKIGELLSCSMDKDGFFIEKHIKLAPVETASAGKFIAGACRGPIDITDSVSQGYAAAILAAKLIMSKSIEKEAIISEVRTDVCSGCGSCVSTCVYQALSLYVDEEGHTKSQVNSILCEGCGACAATCPSNAILMNHFTNDQIEAMIQTAFKETESPAP